MKKDEYYVHRLEQMIVHQLLPVYKRYYLQQGVEAPQLDLEVVTHLKKKEPALFKIWPLD